MTRVWKLALAWVLSLVAVGAIASALASAQVRPDPTGRPLIRSVPHSCAEFECDQRRAP